MRMSKHLILFAVGALLVQAEALATELRKAGHKAQVRDAETWLQYRDAPERADLVMVPPGEQFDELHEAYALSSHTVTVIRDEPGPALLEAAVEATREAELDQLGEHAPAEATASEPLPVGPTREELDAALLALTPETNPDGEQVVEAMQAYFGTLFTVEDAAKVRELLAPPPPPAPPVAEPEVPAPTPEAPAEPVAEKPAEQPAADQAEAAAPAAAPRASRRSAK